jgi:hypothetical protein
MQPQKVSWQKQLQYKFDNFMSRGGWSVFIALLIGFLTAFGLLGVIRYIGERWFPNVYHPDVGDLLWEVFVQLLGLRDTSDAANFAARTVGVLTIIVGLVLFSSLIAFITQEFENKVQQLRKGKSSVVESNHTLIMGLNDRLVDIIQELVIANESEPDAVVVVLSSLEKDKMDDFLRSSLPNLKTTRLVTRTGSVTNLNNLQNVSITSARSVIILNDAKGSDLEEFKSLCDSRTIKSILAVVAAIGDNPIPPIIAELHSEQNRHLAKQIAPGSITTLNEADILARILVQTSRSIGLASVYLNLVGFEGHEFYFYRPTTGWQNLPFGRLPFHFNHAVPMGIYHVDSSLELNPDQNYKLQEGDRAILLAEDDSVIQFQTKPLMEIPKATFAYPTDSLSRKVERHLILGWNEKARTALAEYAKYVVSGSHIGLVVKELTLDILVICEEIDKTTPGMTVRASEANISDTTQLKALCPHEYDSITILAGRGQDAEEIDARTLTSLLELRHIFDDHTEKTGERVTTALIAEIINSEDTELVIKAGVKDFILSNQLVSKILSQVSQNPEVMLIYSNLFSAEGSELYIKPISLYLPENQLKQLTFADCVLAAQARNELCLGIRIFADSQNRFKNFGIKLAPDLNETFSLDPKDTLITLAEDET